ncbi:MAG: cation-translocating P-type ATPase [Candidatus Gracilibacteria bacterium]
MTHPENNLHTGYRKILSVKSWHVLHTKEVLEILDTDQQTGLSLNEVTKRTESFGSNTLPETPPPTLLQIFLRQFISAFVAILIGAAAISLFLGRWKDALMIVVIITINAVLGTIQEWNAEKGAASLKKMLVTTCRVRRDGTIQEIEAEHLVPGDIVLFESGNKVPADIRILSTQQLTVDESFLTGESIAVEKHADIVTGESEDISSQINVLFAGSTVNAGRAEGVVIRTGKNTIVGEIAEKVSTATRGKAPLVIRMEQFSKMVSISILGVVVLLGIVGFLQGNSLEDTLLMSIGLAVAAIPEGLPIAVTVALAIGTQRMAKRKVIIRQLAAVEALGSCNYIASDKTGTLTVNMQTAKKILIAPHMEMDVTGEGYNDNGNILYQDKEISANNTESVNKLIRASVICNEAALYKVDTMWKYSGDSVDIGLLALSYKAAPPIDEILRQNIIESIPFESERAYSAALYKEKDTYTLASKGAYEAIVAMCDCMQTAEGTADIDKELLNEKVNNLAEQGYRVIAVAEKKLTVYKDNGALEKELSSMTFLGLIGLIDPLHEGVKEAVQECHTAGIRVVMVTGDHPATAFAIAKELDITSEWDQVVTGELLAKYTDSRTPEETVALIQNARVFARVSPFQKVQIVETLSKLGNYVAVTGDGVNDAPALKKAHIGIAMGSGTDVAKDTASIILQDDQFPTLVAGIEEGRVAYDNIRKAVYLLIPTGAGLLCLFALSLFSGLPVPFFPLQLLWINLVTNGVQEIALAFEKKEPGLMQRPPRPTTEGIFNRRMIEQVLISGSYIGLLTFFVWTWMLHQGFDESFARTLLLLLMVLMQNVHVFTVRSEYISAFKIPLRNNLLLVAGVIIAHTIHLIASNIPFLQDLLQIQPVSLQTWLLVFVAALSLMILMEVYKVVRKNV